QGTSAVGDRVRASSVVKCEHWRWSDPNTDDDRTSPLTAIGPCHQRWCRRIYSGELILGFRNGIMD
ncbi:MAG: hypothetical protein ACRCSQ_10145, partial [Bacteroidales bacterium]